MKWKKADRPRKSATVNPTGVSSKVIGSANVLPGGPVIYLATIGSVKSLAKAITANIWTKWKKPAIKL